jgi:cytochrome c5
VTVAHDKKFFDTFMLVLGILIAIAVVLYILARIIASNTQDKNIHEDPRMKAAVAERIAPVARVAIEGQANPALEAEQKPAAAEELAGDVAFNRACVACHGAGVAGAPKHGDKAAWAPRLAKGIDTLHKHALEGFQGQAGFMPPKGGAVDLTDKSVTNAVDYMAAAAR